MTIALAVGTPQGIILASESREITASTKWFKDFASKIYSNDFVVKAGDHPKIHKVGSYALIYSGTSALGGWTSNQEIAKLHHMAMAGTGFKALADSFYAKLQETLRGGSFGFLLCGYDRGGNQLWAEGTSDMPLEVNGGPGTQPRYCLRAFGTAEAIGKLLDGETIHYENMSLQEAFSLAMLSMTVGCKCQEWFEGLPAVSGGNIYVAAVTPGGIEGYKFPPYDPAKPAPATPWQVPGYTVQPVKNHGVGGHIYSTQIRSGGPEDTSYTEMSTGFNPLRIVEDGKLALDIYSSIQSGYQGTGGSIQFYDVGRNELRGQITAQDDASGDGLRVMALDNNYDQKDLHLVGNLMRLNAPQIILQEWVSGYSEVYIGGDLDVSGNISAQNVQQGDLCFTERECAVCGQPFKAGDSVVLLARHIHEDLGTMCIPIHERCKNTQTTLTIEVPETETVYRLKENGEVEGRQVMKYTEVQKQVYRTKKGYSFDTKTGNFHRIGEGRTISGQLATKEEALEAVTVKRRVTVMKRITVEINK